MMMEVEIYQDSKKKSFNWYKQVIASNGEKLENKELELA